MIHSNPYESGDRFHVGSGAERIEVFVLSRSDAGDYWDGNWLSCEIRLAVGFFVGKFRANLRTDELERFFGELKTLHAELKGSARLESLEEQLLLSLQGDGRGHIACNGEARDMAGTGNHLTFQLQLDQTELFGTLVELGELLNRHPVRGSPTA